MSTTQIFSSRAEQCASPTNSLITRIGLPPIPASDGYPIEPGRQFCTKLSNTEASHNIYYESKGNSNGRPVLALHGGPSYLFPEGALNFINLDKHRLITMHQRGAGRSFPRGNLSGNTPNHLIMDCEQLRMNLGIEKWIVFGWSFGAFLALSYAAKHPQSIHTALGYGTHLGTDEEEAYLLRYSEMRKPERHARYLEIATRYPGKRYVDILQLLIDDGQIDLATSFWYDTSIDNVTDDQRHDTRIAIGYGSNRYFADLNGLLDLLKSREIPPIILCAGSEDTITPCSTTTNLGSVSNQVRTEVIPKATHDLLEPNVQKRLCLIMDSVT